MNDQVRYFQYLKTHKRGDLLEIATFRMGELINVIEFTKDETLEDAHTCLAPKIFIRLENKTFYLILNGVEGTHISSGRKLAATTRLKKTSKIEIVIGDGVIILHFAPIIKTTKTKRSLPIGVYLLLSFLAQFSVLIYCFAILSADPAFPSYFSNERDCIYAGLMILESPKEEESWIGRGGGMNTRELEPTYAVSPYRDLDDAALYASLKSIQLSGQLSHRDVRRVFDANQVAINTCKTRFPEAERSVSFTIYPMNKIQRESITTDFSNCAFQTISQMAFPTSTDEKPVGVRILL